MPTLPARIVDRLKLDVSYVGLLLSFYAIGLIVVTPIVSIYSDRFKNRKNPMIIGLAGLMITTLCFAYSQTFWGLALARLGQGISAGTSWTIGFSMISDLYKPAELGSVMGYVLSANTLGFLVGPPLGGILSDSLGETAPYLFCTGLTLLDLAGRLYIQPDKIPQNEDDERAQSPDESSLLNPHTPSHSRSPSAQIPSLPLPTGAKSTVESRGSMLFLLKEVQVLVTCLGIIIGATVFSGIEPTLPIHLSKVYGLNASSIGMVWMAIVIPNMAGSILSGHLSDKYGRKNITALGLLIFSVSCFFMSAKGLSLVGLTFILLSFGFTAAFVLTPGLPEFADFCEELGGGMYAQSYALYNIAYSVGMMLGPLLGGYLLKQYDFSVQMVVFGSMALGTAPILFYFWWRRKYRSLYTILEE